MEPNLQEMIDAAKLRIAEKGQRQAAQEAADQQQDLNNQATVVKLAAALLPEALRDLVEFRAWQDYTGISIEHKRALLIIRIPAAAPIAVSAKFSMSDAYVVTDVQLGPSNWDKTFRLCSYTVQEYDDGDEYVPVLDLSPNSYEALEEALEEALSLGNNYDAAEAKARELNEERRNKKTEEPKYIEPVFCPLTVAVEGEQGWCLREQCAWFVTWKGQDNCAVKAIAHSQMNFTPWED